ncbi:MAG: hypothetical protein K6G15_04230 [Desulfovibrio sp.]|nr:hypothetical protein [Desulfovibrio sp.]
MPSKAKVFAQNLICALWQDLGRISGLSHGQTLLCQSLQDLPKALALIRRSKQWRKTEALFSTLPFAEVKKHWGISNAQDERLLCKAQKCAVFAGLLLFAFGLACALLAESPSPLLVLSCRLACLSTSLMGALLAAKSLWRLHCLKKARFIPFRRWLGLP